MIVSINMTDSETPATWMKGLTISSVGPQDSGNVRLRVVLHSDDAPALFAALDADADVLSYEQVEGHTA